MHLYGINLHFSQISLALYNSLHSWMVCLKEVALGIKRIVFEVKFTVIMKEIKSCIW